MKTHKPLNYIMYPIGVVGTAIFSLMTMFSYSIAFQHYTITLQHYTELFGMYSWKYNLTDFFVLFGKYPWKYHWTGFFITPILYLALAIICYVSVIYYAIKVD